jgi:glycerol uptake facilitator-like aquaporin
LVAGRFDAKVAVGHIAAHFVGSVLAAAMTLSVASGHVGSEIGRGPGLFPGSDQIGQLSLFWVSPIVGVALGATLFRYVLGDTEDVVIGHDLIVA